MYQFVVAKRSKEYILNIQFELNHFIHLTGIKNHLKDLPFSRNPPSNLRKSIENGTLTMDSLQKSQFFCCGAIDIAARVRCLANLDEFLRSDSLVFDYLDRADHCSNIKADWMIKGQALGEPCYLFLRSKEEQKKLKNRAQRDYFCLSFFPERGIEYGNNARSMNILYKQRINTETGERETLCCHPGYIPLKQRS